MDYEISNEITPEEYMELRALVGWTLFPLEQAAEGLKNTTYMCCFKKDGKTIGLLRVIWDHGYVFYIADVIVRPEFQGQGLGRELMNKAMDFIKSKIKPGYKMMVSLSSAKGKEEFYKKFGFVERPSEKYGCGMCQFLEG